MRIRTYLLKFRKNSRFVLTIFIGPLAITLFAEIILMYVKGDPIPYWQGIITIIFVLIFVVLLLSGYTSLLDSAVIKLNNWMRARKFNKPKVLILDGTIGNNGHETPPAPAITNFLPDDWKDNLEHQTKNWRIFVGSLKHLRRSPSFQIIINPFGETYPEEDTNNYKTFSDICDYVYSGGIFVHVAGIPFWYCHDPSDPKFINKRITAGHLQKDPDNETLVIQRPLFLTQFPQFRDLIWDDPEIVDCIQSDDERNRFGEIAGAGGNNRVKMFRSYPARMPGLVPLLRRENQEHWLIGSLKYGDGFFILSGLDLRGENHSSFDKVVAAVRGWADYESMGKAS